MGLRERLRGIFGYNQEPDKSTLAGQEVCLRFGQMLKSFDFLPQADIVHGHLSRGEITLVPANLRDDEDMLQIIDAFYEKRGVIIAISVDYQRFMSASEAGLWDEFKHMIIQVNETLNYYKSEAIPLLKWEELDPKVKRHSSGLMKR